jgi:hypothetical protein
MDENQNLFLKKKDFVYLLNKCTMLYIHLNKDTKKDVLLNIKDFIKKLKIEFESNDQLKSLDYDSKKEKILCVLVPYLHKLTSNFMIEHIVVDDHKKEFLIKEIDISSHSYARKILKEQEVRQKEEVKETEDKKMEEIKEVKEVKEVKEINKNNQITKSIQEEKIKEQISHVTYKITNHIDDKIITLHDELNRFFQTKFHILNEDLHHSKIKVSNELSHVREEQDKQYTHLEKISYQIKDEIQKYIVQKNESYVIENYGKVRDEIRDKIMYDLESNIKNEISLKVDKLTHILNKNLETSLKNATQMSYEQIQEFVSKKIEEYEYLIQNTPYILNYDKNNHTIDLMNGTNILSSITLPLIQGPQGPQGVQGPQGSQGVTPQLKKLDITKDGHLSIIVQDERGNYELKSSNKIPLYQQQLNQVVTPSINTVIPTNQVIGKESIKEVVNITKSVHDLNFDKSHVMRLDSNCDNTLIILKSLSIGENSHTLRQNSLAIGGASCFQENSIAIGNKSQALSKNNIALYGSTSGENAFAYAAHNVPSNQFIIGEKENDKYNIQKVVLNAEHIHLNSKNISISSYDDKIKTLEAKIAMLERRIQPNQNLKEKEKENSLFSSILPSSFVQDRFFNSTSS